METLQEQERLIEQSLEAYKREVALVEKQMADCENQGRMSELEKLKNDLSQLIELTQGSLLEVKKQKLLLLFQAPSEAVSSSADTSEREEAIASGNVQTESSPDGEEDDDGGLNGILCQAPLKEAWGAVNYHNALIICKESENSISSEDFKVRVLFTHPLYNAMKPCPFFLEERCKFDEATCKFSHGHVVQFSELKPFQDSDFSLAHVGGKCLAKYSDGLWYPGLISSFGEQFTVHFSTLNATTQLEPDCVVPQESSDESESNGSSNSSGDDDDGGSVRVLEWMPKGAQQALGQWEQHTNGFGSKLLAKMGYVSGQGLGKDSQGRVDPVEIVILPTGKSLDVCAEMREAKKLRAPDGQALPKKRKRRQKTKAAKTLEDQQESDATDIFDFLNTKLKSKGKDTGRFSLQKASRGDSSRSTTESSKSLNVKLLKSQEDVRSCMKRIKMLKDTLVRQQKTREKSIVEHTEEKLALAENHLAHLQKEEQLIQGNISSKSQRRKLTIF